MNDENWTPLAHLQLAELRLTSALTALKGDLLDGETADQVENSLTYCFEIVELMTNQLDRCTMPGQLREDRIRERLAKFEASKRQVSHADGVPGETS